jgi:plastocyanin
MPNLLCFSRWACLLFTVSLSLSSFAATNLVQMGEAGTYYYYNPTNISINAGGTILWTNVGAVTHDSTSRSNLWSSPALTTGGTYAFTFTSAGNYPYYCFFHRIAHPEQTGTVSVVTASNLPPTVLITNPPNAAVFTAPATMTIQASASDDGSVTNVQFLVGSTILANTTTAPYAATTNGLPQGNYTLSAIASDNFGATATNTISVSVTSAPPSGVTILGPKVNGGTFTFSFPTQVGYTYTAQFTASLNPVNWFTLTNLIGDGSVARVTDSSLTNSTRYYRVGAQ